MGMTWRQQRAVKVVGDTMEGDLILRNSDLYISDGYSIYFDDAALSYIAKNGPGNAPMVYTALDGWEHKFYSGTLKIIELDSAGLEVFANAAKTTVLKPPSYTTANAPTSAEGNVYYDTTLHKLRVRGAAGWETITSA